MSRDHKVAEGYGTQILIRWGDRLFDEALLLDGKLTAEKQEKQFGYNNDFIQYMPLPKGSDRSDHGLLCVNHEYPDAKRMLAEQDPEVSEDQAKAIIASLGMSIVEFYREEGTWRRVFGKYNRRISALSTVCTMSGPAAGHRRLQTYADPTGKRVIGTLGNCAGGVTPWGSVLTCEENFDDYFSGNPAGEEHENHKLIGIKNRPRYPYFAKADVRFDVAQEPNEPNRFGWVVEVDPYDPSRPPVKRTALGRFKHEGATVTLAPDGRVVVYSGDDERFQYLYRYVSDTPYNPDNPESNWSLLDHGTLSVARFGNTELVWLPLVYGQGPLTEANGFTSQADVLIETRRAAKLLEGTPMDRPEDVETNPATGLVYVVLTGNPVRSDTNPANPRSLNMYGHILELLPPRTNGQPDHAADRFAWQPFILAGDPRNSLHRAYYPTVPSEHGWLTNPDNIAFDNRGRMWIATDGQPKSIAACDALYMSETEGPKRGAPRQFYRAPIGAEVTGPCFTPDNRTLFLSIQHPGEGSPVDKPSTRWPDFDFEKQPRPALIAIEKDDYTTLA